jgi:hypothetical protein
MDAVNHSLIAVDTFQQCLYFFTGYFVILDTLHMCHICEIIVVVVLTWVMLQQSQNLKDNVRLCPFDMN